MAALTLLPVGQLTLRPLEERFPQPDLPARIDGIILLGGSVHTEMTADRGQPVLNSAAERITEFVALARRYPEARLVFTGGSGFVFAGDLREADVIRDVLDGLGFDISRIAFERELRNTYENAVFSRPLVNPEPGETWLLITSAAHMPRSVGIFRRAGWPVLAYPVDYRSTSESDLEPRPAFRPRCPQRKRAGMGWAGSLPPDGSYRLLVPGTCTKRLTIFVGAYEYMR